MIGFYRSAFLGDNVIAIRALYTLRKLYDCPIIIYTNAQGMQIFSRLNDGFDKTRGFICIDTETMSKQELLAHINAKQFDYFILTQPNRWRCKLLSASNAKCIISFATAANLLNPRIHKVFFSRAFSAIPYHRALLKLVRKIDPTRYDRAEIAYSHFSYPIDECAKARVLSALDNALAKASSLITMGDMPPQARVQAQDFARITTPIICLNPFVKSTRINLPLESYIAVAQELATHYPQMLIVLLHYKGAPTITLQSPVPNLLVFSNDDNLAHIIELLRLSCLLISPSTGTIHLADMLRINTIGIYNRKDSRLWLGESMQKEHLLLLEKPLEQMSKHEIATATQDLLALVKSLLPTLLPPPQKPQISPVKRVND